MNRLGMRERKGDASASEIHTSRTDGTPFGAGITTAEAMTVIETCVQ